MTFKLLSTSLLLVVFSTMCMSQEITMFPGFGVINYYEDENPISKEQVEILMYNDPEASVFWQKSKRHFAYSLVATGVELGLIVVQAVQLVDGELSIAPLAGIIAATGVAIGFSYSSSKQKRLAILKYNANLDLSSSKSEPTYKEIGFVSQYR